MIFYDIKRVSYEALETITKLQAPYKDSGNAYPLGARKHSDRHFRREQDGTFTLWYTDRQMADNLYGRTNDKADRYNIYKDNLDRRMIGRVYPDNTFEFNHSTGMGENMLLAECLGATVSHDKRRGGTVYTKVRGNQTIMHPVFKGLKIDCTTGEAKTPYAVFLPTVNRKAASDMMKQYQDFINVFTSSIKAMDDAGIWEVYVDLYKHEAGDRDGWYGLDMSVVRRLINEYKYVDAGCLFTMLNGSSYFLWRVSYELEDRENAGSRLTPPLPPRWRTRAHNDVTTKFRKEILKQHPEVFGFKQLQPGEALPTSQWGLRVEVGGEPVHRL